MNTQHLKRAAELLLDAIKNFELAKDSLSHITKYPRMPEKQQQKSISEAKENITSTEETLKRQIKYTITELQEI